MVHAYLVRLAVSPRLLLGGLLLAAAPAAMAQSTFNYNSGANVTGTYTDLGGTGAAIATANTDDANSAAQNIGFTFSYNGATFTQFVLNTNGLVRLGGSAPSAADMYAQYETGMRAGTDPITSTSASDANLLIPFNIDLEAGTSTPEYRVATTGTAPNRVCTVQWKNVSDRSGSTPKQYANFSFQLKLYETTNTIEFVYGTATPSSNAAGSRYPTIGIKGSDYDAGHDVLALKDYSLDAWDATVFISGFYSTATHNYRADVGPDAGRTYRFTTCSPTTITAFPYTESFDAVSAGAVPCGSRITDANEDFYPWTTGDVSAIGGTGNALAYSYNDYDTTVGGDDWYFTPALTLRAGYTYQLKFDYAAYDASYPEALEVTWGNASTPAAQTNTLFSNLNIDNEAFTSTTNAQVTTITPTTTGLYYLGFHGISAPDSYVLFVDNIQVTETQVLGVRNQANGVFTAEAAPVPFGESLSLHLNTLKGGPLSLTLRDVMGRAVRQLRTTAPMGSSTVALPEVASLPAGVYLLTVEQGGQSQVLRVAHQ